MARAGRDSPDPINVWPQAQPSQSRPPGCPWRWRWPRPPFVQTKGSGINSADCPGELQGFQLSACGQAACCLPLFWRRPPVLRSWWWMRPGCRVDQVRGFPTMRKRQSHSRLLGWIKGGSAPPGVVNGHRWQISSRRLLALADELERRSVVVVELGLESWGRAKTPLRGARPLARRILQGGGPAPRGRGVGPNLLLQLRLAPAPAGPAAAAAPAVVQRRLRQLQGAEWPRGVENR